MTIELILQVSRSAENRLSGTVRSDGDAKRHQFSGTLELMRVFEDLVPVAPEGELPVSTGAAGRPPQPETAEPSNPKTP